MGRAGVWAVAAALALAGCGGGGGGKPAATVPKAPPLPQDVAGTNVARIPGKSPADVASAAVLTVYPDEAHPPNGLILTPQADWRQGIVAAQFAADPVNGAILPTAGDYIPPGPSDLINRLDVPGFPRAQGLQAVILGEAGNDVLAPLQDRGLKLTQLKASGPEELTFEAVPYRGGWAHKYSDEIVAVSSQERDYALPGAAWSAYSGDTVVFVGRDSVPDATRRVLTQREKLRLQKPTIYLIGPEKVISGGVASELASYGTVKRVAGDTPAATAVALARYKDSKTGFGWGLSHGPASVSLVDTRDWGNVFGALALAGAGPQAPLLLTDSATSIPAEVVRYLHQLRNSKGNQAFVLGDPNSIGRAELEQIDRELGPGSPAGTS